MKVRVIYTDNFNNCFEAFHECNDVVVERGDLLLLNAGVRTIGAYAKGVWRSVDEV